MSLHVFILVAGSTCLTPVRHGASLFNDISNLTDFCFLISVKSSDDYNLSLGFCDHCE